MGLVRLVRGDISKLQWDPWKHLRLAEVSCLEAVQPVKLELCTGEWALEHWLSLMCMQRPCCTDLDSVPHFGALKYFSSSAACARDTCATCLYFRTLWKRWPRTISQETQTTDLDCKMFSGGQSTWVHTDGCNTAPTGRDVFKNLLSLSLSLSLSISLSLFYTLVASTSRFVPDHGLRPWIFKPVWKWKSFRF